MVEANVNVQLVVTRKDAATKAVEYYKRDTRSWTLDQTEATRFDDETAGATKRCLESLSRGRYNTTHTYDTLAV